MGSTVAIVWFFGYPDGDNDGQMGFGVCNPNTRQYTIGMAGFCAKNADKEEFSSVS